MGISLGAFGNGMLRGVEEDRRSRQQMAEAFNQYKAQNPYATAAEFQSFIDQYSGGRNYLKGGAPSQEILTALAADNQKRKARDELAARMEEVNSRLAIQQSMQQAVDEQLMNMTDDNYVGAAREFASQFGIEGSDAMKEFGIDNMFTANRRNYVTSRATMEYLDEAIKMVEVAGGNVSESQLQSAMPWLKPGIVKPLLDQAKRQVKQREEQLALDKSNAFQTAKSNMATQLMGNQGFALAVANGDMQTANSLLDLYTKAYDGVFEPAEIQQLRDVTLQTMKDIVKANQVTNLQAANATRSDTIKGIEQTALDRSQKSVDTLFQVDGLNMSPTLKNVGVAGKSVADALASEYDMSDPRAVAALNSYFASEEAAALAAAGDGEGLANGARIELARNKAPTLSGIVTAEAGRVGATSPAKLTTFTGFLGDVQKKTDERLRVAEQRVNKLMTSRDPSQWDKSTAQVNELLAIIGTELEAEMTAAKQTRATWMEAGSGSWDDRRAQAYTASVMQRIAQLSAKLESGIKNVKRMPVLPTTPSARPENNLGPVTPYREQSAAPDAGTDAPPMYGIPGL